MKWRKRCIIPTSAILGSYHILKVDRISAYNALVRTLNTRSPAFYEDLSVEVVLDSLTNAIGYNIESWDGYIVALAKKVKAVIYTVDLKLAKKVKGIPVVNPIPDLGKYIY